MNKYSKYDEIVKKILNNPLDYEWEIQGFGMLRTYISKNTRLQIWLKEFIVPNVTDIHTHPWNFESLIYQGDITNYCFMESESSDGNKFDKCLILTGENAYVKEKIPTIMEIVSTEWYTTGDSYYHKKTIPHRIDFSDGTITILTKSNIDKDSLAYSYVPNGKEWVSAAPRQATEEEIQKFIKAALKLQEVKNEYT